MLRVSSNSLELEYVELDAVEVFCMRHSDNKPLHQCVEEKIDELDEIAGDGEG